MKYIIIFVLAISVNVNAKNNEFWKINTTSDNFGIDYEISEFIGCKLIQMTKGIYGTYITKNQVTREYLSKNKEVIRDGYDKKSPPHYGFYSVINENIFSIKCRKYFNTFPDKILLNKFLESVDQPFYENSKNL